MEPHAPPGAAAAPTVEPLPDPEQEREELLATLAAEAADDDLPM
jgi:hypothetical protein